MWLKMGLSTALLALLMQVMVLLSPLFLSTEKTRVCVHLASFSQNYRQQLLKHQHIQRSSVLVEHQHHHDTPHHESIQISEVDEKNIHLQYCDFCAIHSELDLPKYWDISVASLSLLRQVNEAFDDYQNPFLSLRLFQQPLKHAPPILFLFK